LDKSGNGIVTVETTRTEKSMGIRERKYAIKLTTGWLPTGTRLEKYGHVVTKCHKCGGRETVNHIMQCPARCRDKQETVQELNKMLEKLKTTDDVRHALVRGIELWINGKRILKTIAISERTRKAVETQNRIGWDMAMRGRLANEWAVIQEHNGDGLPRGRAGKRLGDSWSAHISSFLIQESRRYWKKRNEERQKSSSPEEPDRSRPEVEAETRVRNLYNRVNELAEQDRGIFDVPLERRLQLPVKHQELWADRTLATVNRLAHKERERIKKSQGNIWELWSRASAAITSAAGKIGDLGRKKRDCESEDNGRAKGTERQGKPDSSEEEKEEEKAARGRGLTARTQEDGNPIARDADLAKSDKKQNPNLKKRVLDAFIARGARHHAAKAAGKSTHDKDGGSQQEETKKAKGKRKQTSMERWRQTEVKEAATGQLNCSDVPSQPAKKTKKQAIETTNKSDARSTVRAVEQAARRERNERAGATIKGKQQDITVTARKMGKNQENEKMAQKTKKRDGKLTCTNPYAKSKAKAVTTDEDVQKKETSNSVRSVLDRWLGAREPKFKKKKAPTRGVEQDQTKEWTQVGIHRFFKGKTKEHP
jgi:hypothetical protein